MTIASQLHKLLSEGVSGNQARLVEILDGKGVKTTQSTVSRALKKINAIKRLDENGNVIYALPRLEAASLENTFFESLVYRLEHNQTQIVIHTRPGTANTVAKFIDDHDFEQVMGSVAGDDTIIIVPRDTTKTTVTASEIRKYLQTAGMF